MNSSVQPERYNDGVANRRQDQLKMAAGCSKKLQPSSEDSRKLFQATVNHNIRRIEQRIGLSSAASPTTSSRKSFREWRRSTEFSTRRSLGDSHRIPVSPNSSIAAPRKYPTRWPTVLNSDKRSRCVQNGRTTPQSHALPSNSPNTAVSHPGFSKYSTVLGDQGGHQHRRPTMVVTCTCDGSRVRNRACPHETQFCESGYSLCTECEPSLVTNDCSSCGNPPRLQPYTLHHMTTLKRGERIVYVRRESGSLPKRTYLGGICKRLSPTFTRLFHPNQSHPKGILHDHGQPVLQQPDRTVRFDNKRVSSGGKPPDATSLNSSMWKALMCGTCFEMSVDDDGRSSVNTGESGSDGDDGSDGGGGDDDADADADQGDSASDIEAIEYSSDGGGSSGGSSVSNDGSVYQDELMNEEMYQQDYGNDTEMDEMDFLYRDQQNCSEDWFDGYSYADEEERIRGYNETCGLFDPGDQDRRAETQHTGSEESEEFSEFYFDRYR